ncbi:uncharacterized protein C9orf85 homolog [Linepithema humile]|uniref:uncharacterized protein C9orf85 homolog n=1 Tax=Linepithema humile TaxID=83485 RepID=UPI00351E75BB
MSLQKGNATRSRPQKHQNQVVFKNNLHDNSQKTKFINSIEVANVCERCKKIIEWKIKYKKYKALKAPVKCTKCEQKTVKHSYHNICLPCAKQQKVCPKCGEKKEIIEGKPSKEEQIKLDAEFKVILKTMSERKRRTFLRYMNQQMTKNKNKMGHTSGLDMDTNETNSKDYSVTESKSREDLLTKLKSLAITDKDDDFDIDDETDDNFDSDSDDSLCDKKFSK